MKTEKVRIYQNEKYLKKQIEQGKSYSTIAKENNIGRTTVQRFLKIYGLTKPSLSWSKSDVIILKKYYGHTTDFKKYFPNRTYSSIYHKAHRLKLENHIKPRHYFVNQNFFKEPSKEMAYVLGWLFSDGNITSNKSTFRLKLAIKDIKILEKIRRVLKTNSPIKIVSQIVPSKKYTGKYALLRVNNTLMCQDLIKLGCVPYKTHKFNIPPIPKKLLPHFVRGYFDGDGSISFNKPNTIKIRIVSANRKFIRNLALIFKRKLNISLNYKRVKNIWQCEYYGDNARKICNWMYAGCGGLYLERKRKRFKEHLKKRRVCTNKLS